MSIAGPADGLTARSAKSLVGDRIVNLAVSLAAMLAFLWIAQHVIEAGYQRADIAALEAGEAWKRGGWLSQIVLTIVGYVPDHNVRQSALSLVGAAAAGAILGVLYAGCGPLAGTQSGRCCSSPPSAAMRWRSMP